MLSQRIANIAFNIFIIVAAVWFAIEAQGFTTSGLLASTGLPSKFFPQFILAFIALCSLIIIFLYGLRGYAGEGDKSDAGQNVYEDFGELRRGLLTLAVVVICFLVWREWGFIPMAVIIGPAMALAMGVRSIWTYVLLLLMTGIVWFVFSQFLNVQF